MNKIFIFDTTLRDGEQAPGCSMHINEKIQVAKQLEKLNVNAIEAGFAASSKGDKEAIKEIAKNVKNTTITSLARATKSDIDLAIEALKDAKYPRLHIFLATSPIHLKYKLKLTENQVLEEIKESISYAKKFINDIEFSFEDATRTPIDFLKQCAKITGKMGVNVLNLPDTVGYATPTEIENMFREISLLEEMQNTVLSAHNHNDLGMAVANTLSAIKGGARQVEVTVNGIGERAGNAALEEVVMALKTRGDAFNLTTDINTKEIYRTSKLLSSILGYQIPPNKAIVGKNAFSHEAGIHQHGVLQEKSTYEILSPDDVGIPQNSLVLGKHSGKHAFLEHLQSLGYNLNEEGVKKAFAEFKELCDKKKYVSRKDLDALISHSDISEEEYALKGYEIHSLNGELATANVTLLCSGKELSSSHEGDGPLDASFKAINLLIDKDVKLYDFSIHAVTEGKDALGEATVKLYYDGESFTGKGVSTDIIEASLNAYVNGINKLFDKIG